MLSGFFLPGHYVLLSFRRGEILSSGSVYGDSSFVGMTRLEKSEWERMLWATFVLDNFGLNRIVFHRNHCRQTASLAPIEPESLFHGKLFFLWLAKRPEEALAGQVEKKFCGEKLAGKSGIGFKKK